MIIRITSRFGEISQIHPKPHTGVDIGLPEGTPLHSIGEAVVERIVDYGSENIGKGVILRLADGNKAIYGHMSDIKVKAGEYIQSGEIIGLSGNTGHSTGPHLHLGLKDSHGQLIDPTPFADKVLNINWWDGSLSQFWGWLGEKFWEITFNNFVDWIANVTPALPVIAIVSFGVYALINMFSKRGAKLGALATFIYGLFIV